MCFGGRGWRGTNDWCITYLRMLSITILNVSLRGKTPFHMTQYIIKQAVILTYHSILLSLLCNTFTLKVIGRPFMPPYWSLGFQLCRYGYKSLEKLQEAVNRTKHYNIPHVSSTSLVYHRVL